MEVTINIKPQNDKEKTDIQQALQILANNATRDSLVILANKSCKKGMNEKLKMYQHFL
ncbi:MAG: hypothetical protein JST74_11015 [Bacteroidetes bacterium]|nr:hypothetical protein [Bacteroidota bacterium]